MKLPHHTVELGAEPSDRSLEILSTFNRADIAIVESVLGNNQIACMIVGSNTHYDPMRVLVKEDKVEQALELMRGLKLNFSRITCAK